MSGVTKAITDEIYKAVEAALAICTGQGDVSHKLQMIKSAKKFGITHVAEVNGVSRVSMMRWIREFAAGGADNLRLKAGRGRKSVLTSQEQELVASWLNGDHGITIKKLRFKIESEFGKTLSNGAAHNLIKGLGFSHITPRPVHHKQDKSLLSEFKKKSP